MNPILLIDRRVGFAHAMQIVFNQAGYELTAASTVDEALEIAKHKAISLFILGDVREGLLTVSHTLKSNGITRDLPLLLYSDDWSIHNQDFVQACGADGTLPYPTEKRVLIQKIATHLEIAAEKRHLAV